jgi:hypothetical protein
MTTVPMTTKVVLVSVLILLPLEHYWTMCNVRGVQYRAVANLFVGLNLTQSGPTNWCPMMSFLRRLGVMPCSQTASTRSFCNVCRGLLGGSQAPNPS